MLKSLHRSEGCTPLFQHASEVLTGDVLDNALSDQVGPQLVQRPASRRQLRVVGVCGPIAELDIGEKWNWAEECGVADAQSRALGGGSRAAAWRSWWDRGMEYVLTRWTGVGWVLSARAKFRENQQGCAERRFQGFELILRGLVKAPKVRGTLAELADEVGLGWGYGARSHLLGNCTGRGRDKSDLLGCSGLW